MTPNFKFPATVVVIHSESPFTVETSFNIGELGLDTNILKLNNILICYN